MLIPWHVALLGFSHAGAVYLLALMDAKGIGILE
jgi:hypothetical protein